MGHFWGYDKITVQQIFTLIDKEIIESQRSSVEHDKYMVIREGR